MPIPSENVSIQQDFVELSVDVPEQSSLPRLGWVCPAHCAEDDDRSLGLPVISLAWARADALASEVHEGTTDGVELANLA